MPVLLQHGLNMTAALLRLLRTLHWILHLLFFPCPLYKGATVQNVFMLYKFDIHHTDLQCLKTLKNKVAL